MAAGQRSRCRIGLRNLAETIKVVANGRNIGYLIMKMELSSQFRRKSEQNKRITVGKDGKTILFSRDHAGGRVHFASGAGSKKQRCDRGAVFTASNQSPRIRAAFRMQTWVLASVIFPAMTSSTRVLSGTVWTSRNSSSSRCRSPFFRSCARYMVMYSSL